MYVCRVNIVLHTCSIRLNAILDGLICPSLSAQRKGSWVVERVVGPKELGAPDHTLRKQMSRLQVVGV